MFPASLHRLRTPLLIATMIALAFATFHPVGAYGFLNYDDDLYLANNPWLRQGITWASAQWALSANLLSFSIRAEYWSPVTLFTRLLDAQLFGMNAGPHHVTSVVIHVLNAALLFAALRALIGAWGRSAAVALLFLVHPLNVEPVTWLSARKDLVGGTFFFLTLLAYARYAAAPSRGRYAVVIAAFCGGLMSKPMVVTTPAVLLLLDAWPLKRWTDRASAVRLVAEKVPLFLLAAMIAFLTVQGQRDWGALKTVTSFPLSIRAGNAALAYATYLRRVFWPSDLAIFYPHPGAAISWTAVGIAAAVLVLITIFALRRGWAMVGWLWFLGVLAPVIGIVQVGNQAMADRYAYTSVVGIFILIVWAASELLAKREAVAIGAASIAIGAAGFASSQQLRHWQSSETIFAHALAVTSQNDVAHLNLGSALFVKGDLAGAREHFIEGLKIQPGNATGWNNLAAVEAALGHDEAAVKFYIRALQIDPRGAKSHFHLGKLLLKRGEWERGELCMRRASEVEPGWADPYLELARSLAARGEKADATSALRKYLQLRPQDADARALLEKVTEP